MKRDPGPYDLDIKLGTDQGIFDELTTLRAIRADRELTPPDKPLLTLALLRADKWGRVRGTLETLANDSGYALSTVEKVFRRENTKVIRYFGLIIETEHGLGLQFRMWDPMKEASADHE